MAYVFDMRSAGGPERLTVPDEQTVNEMIAADGARYRRAPPDKVAIWDLRHPSGPSQVVFHATDARDACARSPEQYVAELPPGTKPGPRVGANRIIRS